MRCNNEPATSRQTTNTVPIDESKDQIGAPRNRIKNLFTMFGTIVPMDKGDSLAHCRHHRAECTTGRTPK